MFWSSGILTGNQTAHAHEAVGGVFWSSGILTGNQTLPRHAGRIREFWSSGILTGNQTTWSSSSVTCGFGAVAF